MIVASVSITAPPGRIEELVEALWSLIGPMRVQPGCLAARLYQELDTGDILFYVEEWETMEQLERHLRSPRYDRLLEIMEASAQPPVLRYHMVSETLGLEYLRVIRLGNAAAMPPASGESVSK